MPKLSDLTDYQVPQPEEVLADLPRVYINGQGIENKKEEKGTVQKITDRLLGLNGEERYQLWPEKVVREGLIAAGDVMSGATPEWAIDPNTGDVHTSPQMVEKAQAISALAGTGGLGGVTDATLGATPFLRPALKYKDRLYKGKEGQSHQDVIPEALYPEFNRMAMSGEDISHYNFGFHNDKGHFLNREDALKYGIDTGLIDPQAGQYGALTSTLMADSSKPGTAIEAMAKTAKDHFGITNNPKEAGYILPDGSMLDLSGRHYSGGYIKTENGTWKPKVSEKDWMKDQRQVDHRELDFMDTGGTEGMRQFMNGSGAIRNSPGIGFDTTVIPTDKQLSKIISGHNSVYKGEPLKVDISNPQNGDSLASKEFSKANVETIKKWIKQETDKHPTLFADSSKEATAIQSIKEPFYSALEHNVAKINQSKMTGDQWLGTLSNKPGVKPEELDWTGLKDFLKENGKTAVTKDQIEQHLAANKVELKEVSKGAEDLKIQPSKEHDGEWDVVDNKGNVRYTGTEKEHAQEYLNEEKQVGRYPTKYHSYQLPGASNYREMLLTLPTKSNSTADMLTLFPSILHEIKTPNDVALARRHNANFRESFKGVEDKDILDNIELAGKLSKTSDYKSSHWDEPNILAHVRMNDRNMSEPGYTVQNIKSSNKSQVFATEAEAKDYQAKLPASVQTKIVSDNLNKKSLHLEEIQSDWHQQGRERGYKDGSFATVEQDLSKARNNLENVMSDIRKEHGLNSAEDSLRQIHDPELRVKMLEKRREAYLSNDKYNSALAEVKKLEADAAKAASGVPDAPFKKTWHELALKRMIREAAEKGYDRLSWTPGEAQAARYDLSKQISKLELTHNKDGVGELIMTPKSGNDRRPQSIHIKSREDLVNNVGKDLADKLYEQGFKNNGKAELEGLDLKIGGEGMKGFYDQIIPKALEKIGKEHGVKVKQGAVNVPDISNQSLAAIRKHYNFTKNEWERMPTERQSEFIQKYNNDQGTPIHYIDIPQSLKDQAMRKGFPLFSSTHMFTPIAGDPFEKKK